jgi:hypothetical protein
METKSVFPIVTGSRTADQVLTQVNVGWSILYPGQNYYVVKLQMFPRNTYFMVKNSKRPMEYFVFAKRKTDSATPRFQSLVGVAHLDENLKTHMELEFPLIPIKLYIRLQPTEEVRS